MGTAGVITGVAATTTVGIAATTMDGGIIGSDLLRAPKEAAEVAASFPLSRRSAN